MDNGIYVHVPFCRSRCIYCDFFSTTAEEMKEAYVAALCEEISATAHSMQPTRARTIYIGGGTPSWLGPSLLARILAEVERHFPPLPGAEITVEMNPEDVRNGEELCRAVKAEGVNRVSLGIQTFDDALLRTLRRRHDSAGAIQAVKVLQAEGMDNISIDLIYGLPGQTPDTWQRDLDTAFSLGIQHLSAYALSFEPGTPLWRMREHGDVSEAPESLSVAMYGQLCKRASEEGFIHYEISNFALPGRESRHNSAYWEGVPYLGFGPGAHSYDGARTRSANHPDLNAYLQEWLTQPYRSYKSYKSYKSYETLSDNELYDEFVMCGMRTLAGINLQVLEERFGSARLSYLQQMAAPHIAAHRLQLDGNNLRLTQQALMTSDDIMSDLMA